MESNESFTHRKLIKENNPTVQEIRKSLFSLISKVLDHTESIGYTFFLSSPPSLNVSPNTD